MSKDISKALKKKTDAQLRLLEQDAAPIVRESNTGENFIADPNEYSQQLLAGKNITITTAGNKKTINAVMGLLAGDNILISEPDDDGKVTIKGTLKGKDFNIEDFTGKNGHVLSYDELNDQFILSEASSGGGGDGLTLPPYMSIDGAGLKVYDSPQKNNLIATFGMSESINNETTDIYVEPDMYSFSNGLLDNVYNDLEKLSLSMDDNYISEQHNTTDKTGSSYNWIRFRLKSKGKRFIKSILYKCDGSGNHNITASIDGVTFYVGTLQGIINENINIPMEMLCNESQIITVYITRPSNPLTRGGIVSQSTFDFISYDNAFANNQTSGLRVGIESSATYNENGERVITLSLSDMPNIILMSWENETTSQTSVSIEYAISQDNIIMPNIWMPISSGGTILLSDGYENNYIWIKQKLSTYDLSDTPKLISFKIYSSLYHYGLQTSQKISDVFTDFKDFIAIDETLPTASSDLRGQIFTLLGGAGVADTSYICQKDASDAYIWQQI